MKISTKGRYALTMMIFIGRGYSDDRFVSLKEISMETGVSLKYLEKIMSNLKKCDFFISSPGKDGGYKLKRDPSNYSIGEIIRAAEGNLDVVSCVGDMLCPKKSMCSTYSLWEGLSQVINSYLDSKNLGEFI